jgi:tetratricopeptide (TPR) repeat protein
MRSALSASVRELCVFITVIPRHMAFWLQGHARSGYTVGADQRAVRYIRFIELAGRLVRAAPKEKNMKRTISLWLGLLTFALMPMLAQTPSTTGKIHGHVTNPVGSPQTNGTVSLSTDGGHTSKFTFPVSSVGDYQGEATPGTYALVFRQPDTPADKMVDIIEGIKVVLGQDVVADDDMSRKEFVDKMPEDQKKQLEELRKHNAVALQANEIIKNLNADLRTVAQDIKDADGARQTAIQTLGATASRTEIDAKEAEIKKAKYTDIETLMLKDTGAKPDASVLWAQLGLGQIGLAKYDEAETTFKKVLELEAASKKPNIGIQGAANAGLGEVYARSGKVPEANAAYDAAAKVNPTQAGFYFKNEAVIFSKIGNADAQVAAAEEAIKVDPSQPILYYLKGQGLIVKATVDASGRYVLPEGCAAAYQKYLELAPNGVFAADAKGILAQSTQKVESGFKAEKTKKK